MEDVGEVVPQVETKKTPLKKTNVQVEKKVQVEKPVQVETQVEVGNNLDEEELGFNLFKSRPKTPKKLQVENSKVQVENGDRPTKKQKRQTPSSPMGMSNGETSHATPSHLNGSSVPTMKSLAASPSTSASDASPSRSSMDESEQFLEDLFSSVVPKKSSKPSTPSVASNGSTSDASESIGSTLGSPSQISNGNGNGKKKQMKKTSTPSTPLASSISLTPSVSDVPMPLDGSQDEPIPLANGNQKGKKKQHQKKEAQSPIPSDVVPSVDVQVENLKSPENSNGSSEQKKRRNKKKKSKASQLSIDATIQPSDTPSPSDAASNEIAHEETQSSQEDVENSKKIKRRRISSPSPASKLRSPSIKVTDQTSSDVVVSSRSNRMRNQTVKVTDMPSVSNGKTSHEPTSNGKTSHAPMSNGNAHGVDQALESQDGSHASNGASNGTSNGKMNGHAKKSKKKSASADDINGDAIEQEVPKKPTSNGKPSPSNPTSNGDSQLHRIYDGIANAGKKSKKPWIDDEDSFEPMDLSMSNGAISHATPSDDASNGHGSRKKPSSVESDLDGNIAMDDDVVPKTAPRKPKRQVEKFVPIQQWDDSISHGGHGGKFSRNAIVPDAENPILKHLSGDDVTSSWDETPKQMELQQKIMKSYKDANAPEDRSFDEELDRGKLPKIKKRKHLDPTKPNPFQQKQMEKTMNKGQEKKKWKSPNTEQRLRHRKKAVFEKTFTVPMG
eukprot:TRINITY_DN2251_c0_g5_i2.p1 TRINITY_DN2251_c0_g5~~TRINITY_DN2251_c0_g5_i2.p1  ORF type:complete len:747 (-),score=352.10 TRINITY_DN2251_c0_g5_i2:125-2305(-)